VARAATRKNATDLHIYVHGDDEVSQKLDQLLTQGRQLMADVTSIKKLVTDIDTETNAVAAKVDAQAAAIQALKDQLAAGGTVTAADLQAIEDGLTPISTRLKALGSDPTNPIPA
jgi:septal ring factor EnvC (AmiA/AmiB activator)